MKLALDMQEHGRSPEAPGSRVPSAVPGCDLRRLPLTPTEAYVFSRIDGHVTEAELIACMGLEALLVTAALERLAVLGAIRFEGGAPKRAASQTMPRARQEPTAQPAFHGGDPRKSDVVAKRASQTEMAAARAAAATGAPAARRASPVPGARPGSARPGAGEQVARYLDAARIALDEGNAQRAANFCRLAEELGPVDPAIRAAIEECLAKVAECRSVTDRSADLVRRGDVAARERLWSQAARDYEAAALLVPKNAAVLHKVAGALFRCDEFSVAAQFATRAVSLAPGRLDTWLLLVHIHHAKGATIAAREALAEAQRLAPGDERVTRLDAKIPR